MKENETNIRTKSTNNKSQSITDHPLYSILKDLLFPLAAIVISCIALSYSNHATQEVKSNNELVNNYTVNMNEPTFNFKYSYGNDSKDIIISMDIENVGASLSTNTIQIYPYIEVLLRNNKSEEDYIQQEEVVFPSKDLYETVLVPVGRDIFDIEYINNRTGILATITQNSLYEKLIQEIEDCDETLQGGEKILCMRLKCYMDLNYRDLNNEEKIEIEKWNTGYVKKCSGSDYYKIKGEDLGVLKIEEKDEELGDYKYVNGISTGRFIPDSRQSLTDAIEVNKSTNRSGFISIEVKRLDQFQFSKQVKGEPGDIVMCRIHMINTTENTLEGWGVRIISPLETGIINNRTIVVNSFNPNGLRVRDGIDTNEGINIGNYSKNGDAYIYTFHRVGEDAKKVDHNSIYRIIAQCSAGHETGTIEDYADVLVESE